MVWFVLIRFHEVGFIRFHVVGSNCVRCWAIWFDSSASDCIRFYFLSCALNVFSLLLPVKTYMFLQCVFVLMNFIGLLHVFAHVAQNARLAAPCVTFGALLIWSVVEWESHIHKTLLKLTRDSIFSFMNWLPAGFWSHRLLEPSTLEPSGAVWSHLVPSGVIWSNLDLSGVSGAIWNHLEPWSHVEASEGIWSYLDLSGGIWSLLGPTGGIWNHQKASGAAWSHLEVYGPSVAFWNHLKLSGYIWELSEAECPHMLSYGSMCFDLTRLDLIRCVWSPFVSWKC